MLTTFIALLALGGPAQGTSNLRADSHLAKRQFRLAAQLYRESLQTDAGDPELRLGLARAWAGLGWCQRAVPELEALRPTSSWTHLAALDLGACLADDARGSEAVEAVEEAVSMIGEGTGAEVRLAWEALTAQDLPLFGALSHEIIADDPTSRGALLMTGAVAWVEGDTVAMDLAFDALALEQPRAPKADLIRAWAALEAGDPEHAAAVLRGENRLNRIRLPEVATWLAEANRRAGRLDIADAILHQQVRDREVPLSRVALRLRLLTDMQGPQAATREAERLLAARPLDREVVATAWYVAQAAGDSDRAADLARRYDALVPAGRWPLTALLPLPAVTDAAENNAAGSQDPEPLETP